MKSIKEVTGNKIVLLLFVIAVVSVISAFVTILYSSKVNKIKEVHMHLMRKNELLSKEIAKKRMLFEEIEDKISNMNMLIDENLYLTTDEKIKKFLQTLTPSMRDMILASIPSGYPSSSKRVTSKYGYRIHPIYKDRRFHHGIDFGGKIGTPIKATADGIVEFAGFNKGGYGNLIIIDHNFGFETAYAHLRKNLKVKKGDFVKKGEVIGYLGNSGLSTGPHLHYEIKYLQSILNPIDFIHFNRDNFKQLFYNQKRVAWQNLTMAIVNYYIKMQSVAKN